MKRHKLFLVFLMPLCLCAIAQDEKPGLASGLLEVHDLFNASGNQAISCYRIPALVTATNGDLLAAIDERVPSCQDLRGSNDINIVIRRSSDHGKTWSEIERVVDFPEGESASDPSMIVDRQTGEIFLFYNYMNLETEKDIYYLHLVKSTDHGESWSEPEDITNQITPSKWRKDFKFITSGRGIQTRSGKLLHCIVKLDHGLHLFGSNDHGESWYLLETPLKPGDESKVVELADGRWMVNSRVNKKGMRFVHISDDEGQSWESRAEPELIDPGCNGSIIRYTSIEDGYKKNRLIFCNAKHSKGRQNLTVRISYDEGVTWTTGKTIYPGSAAYSSLTVLENGDIGIFFEKDYYAENLFVSFTLDWLTDGEDRLVPPSLPSATHDLVFDQLADSWDEGIPLGNGMIGALIWQKEGNLRISLDRADLWDLRPMSHVYKQGYNYQWVYEQWEKKNYKTVQEAFDLPYDQSAGPSKIPAAALEIPIEQFGPVERVRLHTHQGICSIHWKNGISMELFIDPEEPVGWFRILKADRASEIKIVPPPYALEAKPSSRNKVTGGQDLRRLGYPQGVVQNGKDKMDYVQEGWNGFLYRVSCLLERQEESITGCWSLSSHFPDKEPKPQASEQVENAQLESYEKSLKGSLTWWSNYWSRSSVSLPDQVLEKQYYLEMYKFGAAARKGAPPISLQAVWTADNGKLPPWKGDFHHDLNTQLSYWPAYTGNQLDLEEGFLDWLWSIKEEGQKYTRWFYGVEGLNIPGVTTLTGEPMGGWIQYSFGPTVSAWLAHHFYLHWKFSQDESFLKERAYPWIREVAVFLDQIAVVGSDGLRKLPISSSPEIFDNSREAWFGETTNYDLALIQFLYTAAAELATELGLEKEADQWRGILSQWPQLLADPISGLMFAPGFSYEESHRHFSHLMGFHPLGLLDISNGEADRKIIYNTLRNLEKHGPDHWTGYSYSWLGNLYARAFEGEKAAMALTDFATCFTLPSSFHVNGDQSGTGKSKFTYRPFTLEGNFAFASGIQEMLLQSHTGVVRIFPAIPPDWKEVSFQKLRTQGAFLVSAFREEGVTTWVEISAEKAGMLRLADPFDKGPDAEILEIPMKKGERILIKPDSLNYIPESTVSS